MGFVWYWVTDGDETKIFSDKSISRDGTDVKPSKLEADIGDKISIAISGEKIAGVKKLLSEGINLNPQFHNGRIPLLMVIDGSHKKRAIKWSIYC